MNRFMMLGAAALALTGCFEKEPRDVEVKKSIEHLSKIELSANSPDAAVKSWWRLKDASALVSIEVCKSNQGIAEPVFEKLEKLANDDLVIRGKCRKAPIVFDRQITKVEIQSETRAVVLSRIKNITPPEEGSVLNEDARKAKEAGEPFQYLLEREGSASGWKITKITNFPSYASDWRDVNEKASPSNNQYVYGFYQ